MHSKTNKCEISYQFYWDYKLIIEKVTRKVTKRTFLLTRNKCCMLDNNKKMVPSDCCNSHPWGSFRSPQTTGSRDGNLSEMSVYPESYNERLCQNDRRLSLDRTVTPRRVLHVNGAYYMIRDAPSGQETMAIHGTLSRKPGASGGWGLRGQCAAIHSGRFAQPVQ